MTVDDGYRLLAARSLQGCVRGVIPEIEGVRRGDPDIEYVHRMRVATRRTRAVLATFAPAFPRKAHARWTRVIKRTTKSLGQARDCDVQIDFLQGHLAGELEKKNVVGIERVILRLRQQRERLQPAVARSMDRLEGSGVLDDMASVARALVVEAGMRRGDYQTSAVFEAAYRGITTRLEEMIAFEPFLPDPANVVQLHDMRIAAKRLRYTMELFAPVYDGALKRHVKAVKTLQSLLGDIHDCDVWDDFLDDFVGEEQARWSDFFGHLRGFRRVETGIQHLRGERSAERRRLHGVLVKEWASLRKQDEWSVLWTLVREGVARSTRVLSLSAPTEVESAREPETALSVADAPPSVRGPVQDEPRADALPEADGSADS